VIGVERMVDLAVAFGQLQSGTSPQLLSRSMGDREVSLLRRGVQSRKIAGANRWTEEEQAFVRETLGYLGLDEIANALGRSKNAVKILYTRKGWPAPSKQPHELTACQIARRMRACVKKICLLIDIGILPGRVMPGSLRRIHLVRRVTFERWLVNPANWIYFDHRHIADRRWRRLVELAKQRWPDEWLTTGQAARLLGLTNSNSVNARIKRGQLPARRWANWHVLRSDVERQHVVPGKGSPGRSRLPFTERGDTFLQFARAEGKGWAEIGKLMGPRYSEKRAPYRHKQLQRRWETAA